MLYGLFVLTYAALNRQREVAYDDSPRTITVTDSAIDPDQPVLNNSSLPDNWPYADGAVVATYYEAAETVTVYATRTAPFARFTVAAAPPASACDLQVDAPVPDATGFSFTATTGHPPFASSLTPNAADFIDGKTAYAVPAGQYTVYVRDALGCQLSRTVYVAPAGQPAGPTYPPTGAILLLRRGGGAFPVPGVTLRPEYWYNPATRTAQAYSVPDTSTTVDIYSRPATDIIDRFCVDPGVAPFREMRVTHNGNGGVTFTPVDGVTTCMVTCTLTLTLSATPIMAGRADLTATPAGAQGAVLYSLDGFQTQGQTSNIFRDLRPGAYTVSARETRPGGCSATARTRISAPYTPRYALDWRDNTDALCELRILEREFAGVVEDLEHAQVEPATLDWPGSPTDHVFTQLLRGSECQLAFYVRYTGQYRPLFSGDERLHRVEYRRLGVLEWTGYLLPEQYDVLFLAAETIPPFNLSATDGLGTLSGIPFAGAAGERLRGDWTLLEVVQFCLDKLDLGLPLNTLFNLYPSTATLAAPALEQARVDVAQYQTDKGTPWDCGRVLRELLTTFQVRLYQEHAQWWFERLIELGTGPLTYQHYAADGTRGADVTRTLLREIDRDTLGWRNADQRQGLLPAVARIRIEADPGDEVNLLRAVLPTNTQLPALLPSGWAASPGAATSELLYQGKDKTPTLRLTGTTAFAATPQIAPWVQTPPTLAPPLRGVGGGLGADDGSFTLSFTAKPYGNSPATPAAPSDVSTMYVAVHFGNTWIAPGLAPENPTTPVLYPIAFADGKEVKFSTRGFSSSQRGPQPVYVRFVVPVGGPTACTVDIADLSLTWQNNELQLAEAYATAYNNITGRRVTRVDEGTTLFHSDTPYVRRAGTLLDNQGLPTAGWREPADVTVVREAGDFAVRDRYVFESGPAQTLRGTLEGPLGPGALVTDPTEPTPAVYLLTSATHQPSAQTWGIAAAQLRSLVPPPLELPDYAIYNDDLTAQQGDAGQILVYEHV